MDWETQDAAVETAPHGLSLTRRERQICLASHAAGAAYERIARAASSGDCACGDLQDRVRSIFRWYFLSAFCTRLLTDAAHRLEYQTLQVSVDIFSALRMGLTERELERSMAMVSMERTSPTEARAHEIGSRGHLVGWVAAGLHEKGREFPAEIENALAGALAAAAGIDRLSLG